jgi:uncharacterized protein (TIGR04255 family)
MDKQEHPSRLTHAPLCYVVGQVIFNPMLKIAAKIEDIQERFRQLGFLKLKTVKAQALQFGSFSFNPEYETYWVFINKTDTASISLTPTSVAFDISTYTDFPDFATIWSSILTVIKEELNTEIALKLGIRYVDCIHLKPGKKFRNYLKPALLGFEFTHCDAEQTHAFTQSMAITNLGRLLVKSLRTNENILLPHDLMPSITINKQEERELNDWVTFLDFDHITEKQEDFQVSNIINIFEELHEVVNDAFFDSAITSTALEEWR